MPLRRRLANTRGVCPIRLRDLPGWDAPERALLGAELRAFFLVIGAMIAPAAVADEVDDAHKRLLQRGDLQFEFKEPLPDPPPPSSGGLADFLAPLGSFFNLVFWGALAAVVLAIAYFIFREIAQARYGRDAKLRTSEPVQTTQYRPEPERARALLQDADQLAQLGRYEEAVRTLLHRSIDDIEGRTPRAIRRAQTSREIASLPILPEPVREAFAPLVRAVERSWFGGLPLGAEDYHACRESYARFALPEAWQ